MIDEKRLANDLTAEDRFFRPYKGVLSRGRASYAVTHGEHLAVADRCRIHPRLHRWGSCKQVHGRIKTR